MERFRERTTVLQEKNKGKKQMSNINDFKDLRIWQKGMEIAEKCYFITKLFPQDELYGMVQQIRRSAVSILANIAEGYGRRTRGEYLRFLNIAQGSINELETHLILSKRLKLCPEKEVEMILTLLKQKSKMIISLMNKLEN